MNEERELEDVLREGLLVHATVDAWAKRDIWHVPSVRAMERWRDEHSERLLNVLAALAGVTIDPVTVDPEVKG